MATPTAICELYENTWKECTGERTVEMRWWSWYKWLCSAILYIYKDIRWTFQHFLGVFCKEPNASLKFRYTFPYVCMYVTKVHGIRTVVIEEIFIQFSPVIMLSTRHIASPVMGMKCVVLCVHSVQKKQKHGNTIGLPGETTVHGVNKVMALKRHLWALD